MLIRSHLKYCIPFWVIHSRKDIDKWEQVQGWDGTLSLGGEFGSAYSRNSYGGISQQPCVYGEMIVVHRARLVQQCMVEGTTIVINGSGRSQLGIEKQISL